MCGIDRELWDLTGDFCSTFGVFSFLCEYAIFIDGSGLVVSDKFLEFSEFNLAKLVVFGAVFLLGLEFV
jgi:hypothetical protein